MSRASSTVAIVAKAFAKAKTQGEVLAAYFKLRDLMVASGGQLSVDSRLDLIHRGALSVVFSWLNRGAGDANFCVVMWSSAYTFAAKTKYDSSVVQSNMLLSFKDPREDESARLVGAMTDWPVLAVKELELRPCRSDVIHELATFLSALSIVPEANPVMLHLLKPLIAVVGVLGAGRGGSACLSVLRNLASVG